MLWGILFYLWATRAHRTGWRIGLGLLSGTLLGYSLFIRYTNVVVIPPLALYILCSYKQRARSIRDPANLALFSVLGITGCGLLIFNRWYYGGFFTTSYSPVHGWYPWSAFDVRYAMGSSPVGGRSLIEGIRTLWRNFSAAIPLTLLGLLAMPRRKAALVIGIAGAFFVFFSFYAFAPTGINARFLLPVLPMMCLATAYGLGAVSRYWLMSRTLRIIVCSGVIAITILPNLPDSLHELVERNHRSVAIASYVQSFTSDTPANAVFMSYVYNDWIIYYGQRSVLNYRRIPPSNPQEGRYQIEFLEPRLVDVVNKLLKSGTPVFYVKDMDPSFWGVLEILQTHYTLELYRDDPQIYRILPRQ